jgi:hypothetical protein
MDLGRYALTMHSLRTAAADAARAAVVHARAADCGATAMRDASRTGILGPTLGLTVTCPRSGGITTVTVTATRPFRFVVPVLGTSSLTLTENASFRFAS